MSSLTDLNSRLEHACSAVGLVADNAEPIRLGENAIFRLPGGVVIRLSRPGQQAAARREVAVSRWLNTSGVAAVVALANVRQPVEVDECSVTFWDELPAHRPGSPVQVAQALRQLHALPVPDDLPLGLLDPFVRLDERIDSAVTVTADDRAWLRARLDSLQGHWRELVPQLPTCVVHGDAWGGNVAAINDGQVVLLDLERCSIGPYQWDLISTAVKHITYGGISRAGYEQFCAGYGADVTAWSGFALLRDIRELRMTCYVARQAAERSSFEREARLRIDCLRGRRGPRPWPWTPAE